MWPFKKKIVINQYTFWFGVTVETNREVRIFTGSVNMLAPTQVLAEKWFTDMNPHVKVNMITEMSVP